VHQLFIDFETDYDLVNREDLFNFPLEFVIPTKLVRLNKMHLNKISNEVYVVNYSFETFPIENGLK
jgi:hypothetical protein